MKTFQKTLLALVAGSALTMTAQANIYSQNAMAGTPYVGVKLGQQKTKLDLADKSFSFSKKGTSYGVLAGYEFTPNVAAEVEFQSTGNMKDTYTDEEDGRTVQKEAKIKNKNYGVYGVYNYYIPTVNGLYAKGKLGLTKNEVSISDDNKFSESKTGVAGGVGVGYQVSPNFSVEGMYNKYPTITMDKVNNDKASTDSITLGANLKF